MCRTWRTQHSCMCGFKSPGCTQRRLSFVTSFRYIHARIHPRTGCKWMCLFKHAMRHVPLYSAHRNCLALSRSTHCGAIERAVNLFCQVCTLYETDHRDSAYYCILRAVRYSSHQHAECIWWLPMCSKFCDLLSILTRAAYVFLTTHRKHALWT